MTTPEQEAAQLPCEHWTHTGNGGAPRCTVCGWPQDYHQIAARIRGERKALLAELATLRTQVEAQRQLVETWKTREARWRRIDASPAEALANSVRRQADELAATLPTGDTK